MTDRMTELDLVVGSMFTTRPEEDRDLYEDEREWLSDIQDLLREGELEGLDIHEHGISAYPEYVISSVVSPASMMIHRDVAKPIDSRPSMGD